MTMLSSGQFKVQALDQKVPDQLPFSSFSSKDQLLLLPKCPPRPQAASCLSRFLMLPWHQLGAPTHFSA